MSKFTILTKLEQRHTTTHSYSYLPPTHTHHEKWPSCLWHSTLFHLPGTVCSIPWCEIIMVYYKYFYQSLRKCILRKVLDILWPFTSVVTGAKKVCGDETFLWLLSYTNAKLKLTKALMELLLCNVYCY